MFFVICIIKLNLSLCILAIYVLSNSLAKALVEHPCISLIDNDHPQTHQYLTQENCACVLQQQKGISIIGVNVFIFFIWWFIYHQYSRKLNVTLPCFSDVISLSSFLFKSNELIRSCTFLSTFELRKWWFYTPCWL